MPAYDYACQTCGSRFEKHLSFKDNLNSVNCPQCGAPAQRLFSAPTIVFKGSGFYVTDNRSAAKSSSTQAGD